MTDHELQHKANTPRRAAVSRARSSKDLIEAIQCGESARAIRLLKQGADPRAEDAKGRSALWWACAWCRPAVIRELVKRGVKLPDDALMGAVCAGDEKTVRFLIQHGANVNCIASRYSPVPQQHIKQVLLTAALGVAAVQPKLETIPIMLIRAGAKVNRCILARPWPGAENRTMLGMAAHSGLLKSVRAMIAAGAKVTQRDSDGRTALMETEAQGHAAIVKTLLRAAGKNPWPLPRKKVNPLKPTP